MNRKTRNRIHEIIFEADTKAGKAFDIALLVFIVLSLALVMYDSVAFYHTKYETLLYSLEWVITVFFTIEYILRIISVRKPLKYMTSFYGIIDLLSILPSFIGIFYYNAQFLKVFRVVRILRLFKVFKLTKFTKESKNLAKALKNSGAKIVVFMTAVVCIAIIMGAIMYIIEGEEAGFKNIPTSIYWSIVTLTTVGYGDLSPITPLGQFIASILMVLGYGIIAVPTGLVSVEFSNINKASTPEHSNTQSCRSCSREGHADDAIHCKYCGDKLND